MRHDGGPDRKSSCSTSEMFHWFRRRVSLLLHIEGRSSLSSVTLRQNSLLHVELKVIVDGEHIIKATYTLEGYGPLVFACFEVMSAENASIHASHLPNTQTIIRHRSGSNPTAPQQLAYAKLCVEPGLKYFLAKFTEEFRGSVAAFKAAQ